MTQLQMSTVTINVQLLFSSSLELHSVNVLCLKKQHRRCSL